MRANVQSYRAQAQAQANELLKAIEAAEGVIVSTVERECEALRAGRILAANALRMRLKDAARLYLNLSRAARAALWTMDKIVPGTGDALAERRAAFSALLRVELAVLAAERAAAESNIDFAAEPTKLEPAAAPPAPVPVHASARPPRRKQRLRRAS
jgi:hypothetical protein